jgi:hypothetical protein
MAKLTAHNADEESMFPALAKSMASKAAELDRNFGAFADAAHALPSESASVCCPAGVECSAPSKLTAAWQMLAGEARTLAAPFASRPGTLSGPPPARRRA